MWVALPRGMGLHYITPLTLLPTFWLLLYIFSYRKYFPVFLINSFSVNSYNVGSPMREGELRVFLLHHLAVFLWWLVMFSIFSCACWPSVCLLWKNAYYFLIELFGFDIDLCEFLNLFWILTPLSDISFANIFSYSILSHKKEEGGNPEILPLANTWVDLDGIVLSEVSQTKTEKYYMFSCLCGI